MDSPALDRMNFPDNFIWGSATSSYQIEGAAYRNGGGLSVWDMMGRHPGKIAGGDTGELACDHIHRFRDDVDLMVELGLGAYRFSVSWPRVLPEGTGRINAQGLDFYDHLVDALLAKNIDPWLTLFHWDFPYELYCQGGWLNRDSADWFADYTAIIVERLSDRVSHWCTLNEPQIFIGMGHLDGTHAPGVPMAFAEALRAGHHCLLAHGKAVQAIRAGAKRALSVSAAHAGSYYMPISDSADDIEAARQRNFSIEERCFINNTWFSDPMLLGEYPVDGLELFAADMPHIAADDMTVICQPLDYFATNIYWGRYGRRGADGNFELVDNEPFARTDFNWPVTPEVLYWGPRFFSERYHLPVVVTENGMANADSVIDGIVDDEARIEFLNRYLYEYARAIEEGVPAIGYFLWSLLDNFEWAEGYSKRFGITHVDYSTQQRQLKQSAYWYRDLIARRSIQPYQARELRRVSA